MPTPPSRYRTRGWPCCARRCRVTGRGLHIHVAEDRYDMAHGHHHYGKEPIARLDEFGLIDSKSLVAHGIYLSPTDIELLNSRDALPGA